MAGWYMCETCKGTNFDSLDHLKEHLRKAHCGSQYVYVLTCGRCELVLAEATATKNITRSSHLMRQHLYWARHEGAKVYHVHRTTEVIRRTRAPPRKLKDFYWY